MELTAREQHVLDNLELLIRQGKSEDEAITSLKLMIDDDEIVDLVVAFRRRVAAERRTIASGQSIFDPETGGDDWYTGPSPSDTFWPDLKKSLEKDPNWSAAVPGLDSSSSDIVSLLADPHKTTIKTRGLVLGHVQSGKTANFTATIAKAADAGYRLFIVLSGVHNSLRRQTQLRMDEQLLAHQPTRWVGLTDEDRDFGKPVKALPLLYTPRLRIIAVVKKNVTRLTLLRDWLNEAHENGGLEDCPVLVIDDEADQASPNSAKDPELDRTRINQRISELLELPRVAYVGYTATPFANVLVNPKDETDIYPRTFIYSLPKPESYFGSRELFGQLVSEDEASLTDSPHDMIRFVPEDEAASHATKQLLSKGVTVTEQLGLAISWFVMATAARRSRTGAVRHSSMLVHTTMRVNAQLSYIEPIQTYLRELAERVERGELEEFRRQWVEETTREPAERNGLTPVSFEEIAPTLAKTIESVKVLADNGVSTDRLLYGSDPATVIAIGGNTLSRGLTLEGLVSSYFLRSSTTYDTLLQMGRWFGYRPGYGDLPRIWTTEDLANQFEFLSDVEDSLRSEIARYKTIEGSTPLNLPVRIRLHPKMQATARVKMHYAIQGDATFSGSRPQTTYFAHLDQEVLSTNLEATRTLIQSALDGGSVPEIQESRTIVRDLDVDHVLEFVRRYEFHNDSELSADQLAKYIERQREAGALSLWNVVVMGVKSPRRTLSLGLGSPSALISRSKLKLSSTATRAVIGTLMSKPDRVADLIPAAKVTAKSTEAELQALRDEDGRGLLVLYPIDRESLPKSGTRGRVALEAANDIIGVALCFPTAVYGTESEPTVQVDLAGTSDPDDGEQKYEDIEGSQDEVSLG